MTGVDDPLRTKCPATDGRPVAALPTNVAERRYDLDWLRILAFAILIFHHVGLFYAAWGWYLKSRHSVSFVEPIMGLTGWRLSLLFFVSGAAVRIAIDKTTYVELRYLGEIEPGYLAFYRDYLGFGEFSMVSPPWNHLWYLAYILVYTAVVAFCLPLLRPAMAALGGPFFAWLARGGAWRLLFVPAIPFTVYAVTLDSYFPTTLALWGDWANIARTLTFFLFGFLAAKSDDFWNAVDGALPVATLLSLLLGGLVLAAFLNEFAVSSDPQLFTGFLLLRVIYGRSVIVTLLGLARKFANRPSRALTYLTAAILPYYILHQTITLLVSYWFTRHEAPLAIEAATIVMATMLGCVLGYEAVRRVAVLRPLFGLPPRAKAA